MRETVTEQQAGMRLDACLAALSGLSRSAAARLIEQGAVRLNGTPHDKKTAVRPGDLLEWQPPEAVPCEAHAQDLPLDIVYEDDCLLVINKPSGMVVHPGPGNPDGTLVNALLHHCQGRLSGINGVIRPGIVHRIDKDTSGLLVVAKTDAAHTALAEQIARHAVVREYRALVSGGFADDTGTVSLPIGRHSTDRKRMAVIRDPARTARQAVTHYRVLERFPGISYLSLKLETGRTHQIRVHMSATGHPLLGDTVYGGGHTPFEKKHAALLNGQCLHAIALTFTHPQTGQSMTFTAPLPPDFEALLSLLRHASP